MASEQAISKAIAILALTYPNGAAASASPDELRVLAAAWGAALADLRDKDLEDAVVIHMRTGRFFPTPADILAAHQVACSAEPTQAALPPPTHSRDYYRECADRHMPRIKAMLAQLRERVEVAPPQQSSASPDQNRSQFRPSPAEELLWPWQALGVNPPQRDLDEYERRMGRA